MQVELPADPMELFEELAQSMAGVEELTTALSDRLQEAMPQHNLGTGPTDLGLDDINPAPDTPKTPGFGLSHSAMERRLGGLTQSASKSSFKRNISSASLAAMESLRGEPEIWQVRNHANLVIANVEIIHSFCIHAVFPSHIS